MDGAGGTLRGDGAVIWAAASLHGIGRLDRSISRNERGWKSCIIARRTLFSKSGSVTEFCRESSAAIFRRESASAQSVCAGT